MSYVLRNIQAADTCCPRMCTHNTLRYEYSYVCSKPSVKNAQFPVRVSPLLYYKPSVNYVPRGVNP